VDRGDPADGTVRADATEGTDRRSRTASAPLIRVVRVTQLLLGAQAS
jgi:hypothetical protein